MQMLAMWFASSLPAYFRVLGDVLQKQKGKKSGKYDGCFHPKNTIMFPRILGGVLLFLLEIQKRREMW